MDKKKTTTIKTILLIFYFSVFVFLLYKIFEYAPYFPLIIKYTNTCSPDSAGIYEDEIYHHTLPGCSKYIESEFRDNSILKGFEYLIKVDINSLGFRNEEYPLIKKKGQKRIVLLGDSFTFGFGLNIEDTYFKILENKLGEKYQNKTEVWNIAAISWGTVIHYLITRNKLRNYSPDLVVLMFDDSDFYDNIIYEKHGVFEEGNIVASQGKVDEFFKERSKLIKDTWSGFAENPQFTIENISNMHTVALKYILKIDEILSKENIPFLVVFYPYPDADEKYEEKVLQK